MQYAQLAWAWISAHPAQTALYAWMIFNVIWAQCPQPKNPTVAKLWNFSHAFLQLIVTNADKPGTFTLPWLIKAAVGLLSSPPSLPPAAPAVTPPTTQPTAKDAGDDHGIPGPQ